MARYMRKVVRSRTVTPQKDGVTPLRLSLKRRNRPRFVKSLNCTAQRSIETGQTSPVTLYSGEDFTVRFSVRQHFRLQKLVKDSQDNGVVCTEFFTNRPFDHMVLSAAGTKLRDVPNAGGNSVVSEVLSFEVLRRCFGAQLLKTEMEVAYWPEGGSITDYMCAMYNTTLGVSVTRAMRYHGDFTTEDAQRLLAKKLNGIIQSSRNTCETWNKQILHLWAMSNTVAEVVLMAYTNLPDCVRSNTLLLLTVASNCCDVFKNR